MWRTVSLELKIPYFFVHYEMQDGAAWVPQTSLFWREEDLIDFCSITAGDPRQRVVQIARLSPPGEGERNDWDLVTLTEIWKGTNTENNEEVLVLVGKNGDRIAGNGLTTGVANPNLVERIYSACPNG